MLHSVWESIWVFAGEQVSFRPITIDTCLCVHKIMRIMRWGNGTVSDPEVIDVERADDQWCSTDGALVDLAEVLSFEPGGALRITLDAAEASAWQVVAALPLDADYREVHDREVPTGDALFDDLDREFNAPVVINGVPWTLVVAEFGDSGPRRLNWVPAKADGTWMDESVPASRRVIAQTAAIEEGSRTSGWFRWGVEELDDEAVCFIADLDEEGTFYDVAMRGGKSDVDLVEELGERIDWSPAAAALAAAAEGDGEFDGYANELNEDDSDSCLVRAWVTESARRSQ